jgi:methionyl-tRNA synthetase
VHFIRTTNKEHEAAAQEFWKRCHDNGYIYKKNYSAKYCVGCEEVKTDSELVNGECPLHPGKPLESIEEENYFFRYSAFTEKLTAFYASRPDFVIPDFRFNEVKAFVARGLEDFSISRLASKMPWGIPVPGDDTHVMYVWFDALTNYISTLGWFFAKSEHSKISGDEKTKIELNIVKESLFEQYWVDGTPTQYCGKDNLRFQAAMWQAMLMAANVPNSYQIIINGFITGDGGVKMSKSLGNVVDPKDIVAEYGTDALRLFLTKEVSNFEDSPFTAARFKDAYNSNLANGLGNLLSRTLTMAVSQGGIIKKHDPIKMFHKIEGFGIVEEIEGPSIDAYIETDLIPAYDSAFAKFELNQATGHIWECITLLDQTIARTEPFKLVKTDPDGAEAVIYDILCGLSAVAKLLEPILPATSAVMMEHLGIGPNAVSRPEAFMVKKFESPLFPRKA